ncbi:FAD-dependent oxidoreductase [Bacillus sp. FJAT-44742]|uniref:FAD-dependent oxidoreductase n=1 Tax=Bacillus sp. FJAT-44742 TaxID=2014005 RepID=UPI0012FEFEB5|nr:FAD-dependent monooxygenase [Bacillus sp. FJAT-44742]
MSNQPVVIAGAGPVGVTLAEILSLNDIPVLLVEKEAEPNKEWRASTFHAGTMELLEQETGVVDRMLEKGFKAYKVHYRDRNDGLYAEFDFSQISDITNYPFRLQCSQATYVQLVFERLKDRSNVEVIFNSEVVDYTQNEDEVSVTIGTPEGERVLKTPYLLGADGGRSKVRKLTGVQFDGYTHEERWLLVGTPTDFHDYIPDLAYVNYISDPNEFLFILRVPEAWRFLYPVKPDTPEKEALDPHNIQKTIQKALNTTDHFPIVENTIYRIHQRVADKFYNGRVVLVGDAAHLNSPMGGLGLNSGIHDAVDLSRRLVRIFKEGSNREAELRKYSEVRQRVAKNYVKAISEKNTKLMKEQDEQERKRLQKELSEVANDPEKAREWLINSSLIASVQDQGIGKPPEVNPTK